MMESTGIEIMGFLIQPPVGSKAYHLLASSLTAVGSGGGDTQPDCIIEHGMR